MTDIASGRTRWFIPAPGPDETLASVIGRAAAFYGCTVSALWAELHGPHLESSGSLDHPTPHALQRLARALGAPAETLRNHLLVDGPRWLRLEARRAYCPACWLEDRVAGRPFGFRRDWARVLAMRCKKHDLPLLQSHAQERLDSDWLDELVLLHESAGDVADLHPLGEAGVLLRWIDAVGETLDRVLFDGEAWPREWRFDPHEAQRRLAASCNVETREWDDLSITRVMVPPALRRFVHTRCTSSGSSRPLHWEGVQAHGDPGFRRAALWLLGWQLVPHLPPSYCPCWLPGP